MLASSDAFWAVAVASSPPVTPSAKAFIVQKFSYSFIQSPLIIKNTIKRVPQI